MWQEIRVRNFTEWIPSTKNRSRHPEVFYKIGVLKNFAKFTGKHLCQRLSFNKVAGLKPETLLKKRLRLMCFFCEIRKIFKNIFFYRTPPFASQKLLLQKLNRSIYLGNCFYQMLAVSLKRIATAIVALNFLARISRSCKAKVLSLGFLKTG